MAVWQSQPMSDHASQSISSLSTQASSNEAARNARIYQIMLVAHELVLEGKFYPLGKVNTQTAQDCHKTSLPKNPKYLCYLL